MIEQYKILLVDDSIDNLKAMVAALKEYCPEYDVLQTCNPEFAIEISATTLPHLIITDWEMPKFSGIDLIKAIKSNEKTKGIPIIMATGVMLSSDNLKLALDEGAIDFITKPFDPIELVARASSALRNAGNKNQLIKEKDQELTENALYLVKATKQNEGILAKFNQLKNLVSKEDIEAQNFISHSIRELEQKIRLDSWYKFNVSFENVHKDFNKNLIRKFPSLTVTDLKLCAFIRLGISSKEVALLLNQNPDSIRVSRSRLRKKLNIDRSQNIETFLTSL